MRSVILADTDRNFRQALAIALKLDGVEVVAACSLEEALAEIASGRHDVCVVDCLLPGWEHLVARLMADGRVAPVVVGTIPEFLARAQRRHPGLAALAKPFGAGELVALAGARAMAVTR